MSEKFKGNVRDSVEKKMLEHVAAKMNGKGMEALHNLVESYYQLWNIRPQYQQEKKENFTEMREKLNSESGIVISNHPGYVDVPAILDCLNREDVKILVDKGAYNYVRDIIGEKYIVPAEVAMFAQIEAHIQDGGIFIIFPTGGDTGVDIYFQNGFTELVSRMSPEKMVYSFYINADDVQAIEKTYTGRSVGVASTPYLGQSMNVNRLKETQIFKVDERYSTAGEWQDVSAPVKGRRAKTQTLTEHYKNLFSIRKP